MRIDNENFMQFLETKSEYDPTLFKVEGDERPLLGAFDCCRIPDGEVPEGCFRYSIREDEDGCPVSVEKEVYVDHFGDVLTAREIDFKGKDSLEIHGMVWGCLDSLPGMIPFL